MIKQLIYNDVKKNKLLSIITILFMAISGILISLTISLSFNLFGSINQLMKTAKTVDFLQMHTGVIDEEKIENFVQHHPEIKNWQINKFLNFENSEIFLNDINLNNTQDNGLSVQSEFFDYLLDTENKIPVVSPGEIYVPICYKSQYNLSYGDEVTFAQNNFTIAGFIRDSQMNSMLSSSKRFLVNENDYMKLQNLGTEEYLIEFLLNDNANINEFSTAYANSDLPTNGPTITKPLITLMNAISDGMLIFVIFVVSIVIFLISILCIRFILLARIEKDKKEIGMLKALGINKKDIKKIYFSKYIFFAICSLLIAFMLSNILYIPLRKGLQELYGSVNNYFIINVFSFLGSFILHCLILSYIYHQLKYTEKISALDSLFLNQKQIQKKEFKQYLLISLFVSFCIFLMIVPRNIYKTISSSKFVTYMGIGDAQIRIDMRQSDEMKDNLKELISLLEQDNRIDRFVSLQTKSYMTIIDGINYKLLVEIGDHSIFPVSYIEGTFPFKDNEIALSSINAKEFNLHLNDEIILIIGNKEIKYNICGIYSDITNGGKTAKIKNNGLIDDTKTMWNILYVSLYDDTLKEQWLNEYNKKSVTAIDINNYVKDTYGPTLKQISLVSRFTIIISLLIIILVVTLFIKLIVEKERYIISLKKAIGFTTNDIRKKYFLNGLFISIVGLILGILLSNILGQRICEIVLNSLGAEGFKFINTIDINIIFISLIDILMVEFSIYIGTKEIKNITAYECCIGRD